MNWSIIKQVVLLRKWTVVAIAVLFLMALAAQLFINLYQNPKVEKLQQEWMTLREQEGRGTKYQDREALYRNGLADLAKFRERIYLKSQFAQFIGELYQTAAKDGLELVSITYKPTVNKEEQLLNYALTLAVSGKYPQLKRFIYDLCADVGNILVIDSIALTSGSASADSVQLQVQITSWFRVEGK